MLKRLRRKAAEALAASDQAQDYLEEHADAALLATVRNQRTTLRLAGDMMRERNEENARVRQLAEERYDEILELEESLREANQLIAEFAENNRALKDAYAAEKARAEAALARCEQLEADALPEKSPGTITARALNAYAAEKARAEAALTQS